jgi:hypothetical protein
VAGIVAGRQANGSLRGVAPAAQILPIRVFNVSAGHAQAFDSDILAGLYYAYEQRNNLPLAAVNLSVGGGLSSTACDSDPAMGLYVDVIGRLRASGIATTIAAGNDFEASSVAFPACVSGAVTVGATTVSGGVETVASFSDRLFGLTDFVAPGVDIDSSVPPGTNDFSPVDGTSMAAPMIAGAIADIRSAKPIPHNLAGFNAIYVGLTTSSDAVSDGVNEFRRPDITTAIAGTVIPTDTSVPDDPSPITGRFVPVTPRRIVDTRMGARQRVLANTVRFFDFESSEVLPLGASAAALNVTVVGPGASGFLTVFPCITGGVPPKAPDTSNVNFAAGQTVANLVVVGISATSEVCFKGNSDMDVIIDLMGWYGGGGAGAFGAVTPARALDTRSSARLTPGQVVPVAIGGRFGVPTTAVAAVVNVTATDAAADGFLTVFPCAGAPPDTSNVNFVSGRAVPNQVLVGLAAGQLCITTNQPANVLVDVSGFYAAPPVGGGRFTPIVPGRLIDTRTATSKPPARTVVVVPVIGQPNIPANATAVALNVTVDGATGLGFLTVFPCAANTPDSSNVNYVGGLTVANSVTVGIGEGGHVCVYTEASANVLVDVTGYYGP